MKSRPFQPLLLALIAWIWLVPLATAHGAQPMDEPERVVAAFVAAKGADFPMLAEELQLLKKGVRVLYHFRSEPSRRREVWRGLQGLENGNAGPAANILLQWQRSGDLDSLPGAAQPVAVIVGLGDLNRVHAAFRRAMATDTGNPVFWFLLGHALERGQRTELSVLAYKQVQLLSDLSGDPLYGARAGGHLGAIYLQQGKLREAEAQLKEAVLALSESSLQGEAGSAYANLAALSAKRAKDHLERAVVAFDAAKKERAARTAKQQAKTLSELFPQHLR